MKRGLQISVVLMVGLLVLQAVTAQFGGPASEAALRAYDQHLFNAYFAGRPDVAVPQVNGFAVTQRVPLPGVSYYEGLSLVDSQDISCATRRSLVVWYGPRATVIWQDGLWLPDRASVHSRYAETGHVH